MSTPARKPRKPDVEITRIVRFEAFTPEAKKAYPVPPKFMIKTGPGVKRRIPRNLTKAEREQLRPFIEGAKRTRQLLGHADDLTLPSRRSLRGARP